MVTFLANFVFVFAASVSDMRGPVVALLCNPNPLLDKDDFES